MVRFTPAVCESDPSDENAVREMTTRRDDRESAGINPLEVSMFRMILAWTLYASGDLLSRFGLVGPTYQWLMNRSAGIQGDGFGPWLLCD